MAGLATFAVAVLLFAQIVLSADEAKMPAQESLYARSAALIDGDTGRLLYGKEEDVILPMASTTKIMTCILVLEMMEPEEICTASAYAASQPQVHLGVQKGRSFRCEDLLYSLMLESHNDTAVILAEAAAGSVEGFATWMNKKAKEIGLSQTHFVTPNGLDNEAHYTTARELALLLRYCIRTSPKSKEFLKITRTAQYEFTDTTGKYSFSVYNHNAFLQMMEKLGYTRAQTLALWIMFVMTVPQFADVLAPIPTTHNPTAFFVVSLIALASNVALAAYQLYRIRKLKLNPLKDQIYADTKTYQRIVEENE